MILISKRYVLCVISAILLVGFTNGNKPLLSFPKGHNLKISFGSCNKFYESDNSTIFNAISEYNSDLYIWLGDVAYIENMVLYYVLFEFPGIETARKRLDNSKNDPAYVRLRNKTPIIGVWDNHDYGADGGDKNFPHKYEMREAFLDFLDEPADSPRRQREGIYESYLIESGNFKVSVVLLDIRFNKDPKTQDMLGEEQWKWLEKEFEKGYDLYLIGSGSQILPEDRILHDNWFSLSTRRLLSLIRKYKVAGVLLTGDVHVAETIEFPCSQEILGHQLYELTSSGLTHTSRDHFPGGELFDKLFFPETYNKGEERYVDYNFGSIEIEPNTKSKSDSLIKLQIRNINGTVVIEKAITLKDLQRTKEPKLEIDDFQKSMCFNDSTKEERFYKHFLKALTTKEIILWLKYPLLGIITFSLLGVFLAITLFRRCFSKKSSKIKAE